MQILLFIVALPLCHLAGNFLHFIADHYVFGADVNAFLNFALNRRAFCATLRSPTGDSLPVISVPNYSKQNGKKIFSRSFIALWLIIVLGDWARAEQLPIKTFTSADGLASSALLDIFRDRRGFLWFSTRDGLSRFDGREFTNFRLGNAGSSPTIFSFLETRRGDYWIVTGEGVFRIRHQDSPEVKPDLTAQTADRRIFLNAEKVSAQSISVLYEDSAERLWAGNGDGLFLLTENNEVLTFNRIEIGTADNVKAITEARDGSLWIGCNTGVFRRLPSGKFLFYPIERASGYDQIFAVTEDTDNRIWIAHKRGIFIIQPEAAQTVAAEPHLETCESGVIEQKASANFALAQSSPDTILWLNFGGSNSATPNEVTVNDVFAASDAKLWFSAQGFLYVFTQGQVRRVSDSAILPAEIENFAEDSADNLWIGTSGGALRLTRQGFTTFDQHDGLADARISSIYQNAAGEIYVTNGQLNVSRLKVGEFESKLLGLPAAAKLLYASSGAILAENDWWVLTDNGLYRFDINSLQTPRKIYRQADGLKSDFLFRGFRDSKGNLWFSSRKGNDDSSGLSVFDHLTQRFHAFTEAEGFPFGKSPASFAEDESGNLWFGFYDGGLVRYTNGHFTDFSQTADLPAGGIFGLWADAKNRLWIASSAGGVAVVENPSADELNFKHFTTEQGLASNNARCLTEDFAGNIYVGTVRGIDRITPETGQIRHFSTSDGLAGDFVSVAFRDQSGTLWFGTSNGLSKIEPQADFVQTAPEIFISGLQIAGVRYAVSGFGQQEINGISLSAAENNLEIDFLSGGGNENSHYQYKLEGAANEPDWSSPTAQRTVNLASLAPGAYQFSVRAVNAAGKVSRQPAVISFRISPPFWRTAWFIALILTLFGAGIFALERFRANKRSELKKAFGELRVSETRFRQMVEQSPLGTVVFAPDGSIRAVNRAYENFWGVSSEEFKNWNFLADEQIIKSGGIEQLRRVFDGETLTMPPVFYDPQSNGGGADAENAANGARATPRWIQSFAYPVKNDAGELLEVIVVMEDVTDTKRAAEIEENAKRERFRELEQVRRRIATDLHDDIGSSLTQIAVLSEVAKREFSAPANGQTATNHTAANSPLERITQVSLELVGAMSDIVWAINPQKDNLHDLVQRMRRFVHDIFTARGVEFEFHAPDFEENIPLGANIRREIFVIFKESVNNIIKHSKCRKAQIALRLAPEFLLLEISDDGRGFVIEQPLDENILREKGNGLVNIRRRAIELGGSCEIISAVGAGSQIKIKIPLAPSAADYSNK